MSSRTGCSTSSQNLRWALIRLGTFPNRVSADTWRSEQNSVTDRKGQVKTFSLSDRLGGGEEPDSGLEDPRESLYPHPCPAAPGELGACGQLRV